MARRQRPQPITSQERQALNNMLAAALDGNLLAAQLFAAIDSIPEDGELSDELYNAVMAFASIG